MKKVEVTKITITIFKGNHKDYNIGSNLTGMLKIQIIGSLSFTRVFFKNMFLGSTKRAANNFCSGW